MRLNFKVTGFDWAKEGSSVERDISKYPVKISSKEKVQYDKLLTMKYNVKEYIFFKLRRLAFFYLTLPLFMGICKFPRLTVYLIYFMCINLCNITKKLNVFVLKGMNKSTLLDLLVLLFFTVIFW